MQGTVIATLVSVRYADVRLGMHHMCPRHVLNYWYSTNSTHIRAENKFYIPICACEQLRIMVVGGCGYYVTACCWTVTHRGTEYRTTGGTTGASFRSLLHYSIGGCRRRYGLVRRDLYIGKVGLKTRVAAYIYIYIYYYVTRKVKFSNDLCLSWGLLHY